MLPTPTTMADEARKSYPSISKPASGIGSNNKTATYNQMPNGSQMSKPAQESAQYGRNLATTNSSHEGDYLAEGMNRMNLQAPWAMPDKFSRSTSGQSYDGGLHMNTNIPHAFMYNGQLMFASQVHHPMAQGGSNMTQAAPIYAATAPQYLNQANFPYGHLIGGHSPLSTTWPGSRVPSGDMPSLITPRRDSSSSQENEAPGTPFNHYGAYGDYSGGVAVVDRSPHSVYGAWSTPSPPQNGFKPNYPASISPRLQLLVQQDPPIPRAVPAPYSPVKPLDRSLENMNGVTNVYIRGLVPDTTDEMLKQLASRFGDIVSSKSIIDHSTGKCKGFGFVKYHNFKDAEDCIRGFHFLGYETSFARESFYSQLKKLSDEANTNLYVSNLPKDMNEHELGALFGGHKVCSSRILRDSAGNGRGVGFARFESREVCEEVIKHFDKTPVTSHDGQEYIVQIRYADTQDQKALKQQTTAARQYRTAEYESQTSQRPPWVPSSRSNAVPERGRNVDTNDFEAYLTTTSGNSINIQGRGSWRDRLTHASPLANAGHGSSVANGSIVHSNSSLPEPRVATVDGGVKLDCKTNGHHHGQSGQDGSADVAAIDNGIRV